MAKFKIKDKHVLFGNAVAGGMSARAAYIEHMAVNKKCSIESAAVTASRLMARPEIQDLIQRARLAREEAITGQISRNVAKEFSTVLLTVEELDAFHSAVVQGLVEVEEVVPVYKWIEKLDKDGNVVGRSKEANFVRITRKANIRERQISIAELYKRGGNYAPTKSLNAFKGFGGDNDDEGEENVQRMLVLSDGTKIPLP